MRVILETVPTPMTMPQGKRVYAGTATFRVVQYEPDEDPPPVPTLAAARRALRRLSDLRGPSGRAPLVATPDDQSPFKPFIPPVIIPETVLAPLNPASKLFYEWRFFPRGILR
ncbi:MAG: hypothetical protein ACRDG6_10160 [Candidatus Limnocylindria bacterium]